MSNFLSCRFPPTATYIPDSRTGTYEAGDICSIYESTSTPIYLLLTGKQPPSRKSVNRTWGSFVFARSTRSGLSLSNYDTGGTSTPNGGNPRPCLILRRTFIAPASSQTAYICLMATFDNTREHTDLPLVLRHFAIPIYPHTYAASGFHHTHSTPTWPKEGAWIIALPFESSSSVVGRWEDRRRKSRPDGSFMLSEEDYTKFYQLCLGRREEWDAMCQADPRLRNRAMKEFKDARFEVADKRKRQYEDRTSPQPNSSAKRHGESPGPGPSNSQARPIAGRRSAPQEGRRASTSRSVWDKFRSLGSDVSLPMLCILMMPLANRLTGQGLSFPATRNYRHSIELPFQPWSAGLLPSYTF
ncbi:hypothetical protein BD413DRAFT_537275 [Trametes elegans]|nr:hypothetical protein BD413DRAFT_537275 [Trametes elegans]